MKINHIEIRALKIPFKLTFSHNLAKYNYSDNLIVLVYNKEKECGIGESIPRLFLTGERIEDAPQIISSLFNEHLLNTEIPSLNEAITKIKSISHDKKAEKYPATFCALEIALLDLFGKQWTVPIHRILDKQVVVRNPIEYSIVLPLLKPSKIENIVRKILSLYNPDFWKIKLPKETDLTPLITLRNILGEQSNIRIDINEGWTTEQTLSHIKQLEKLGISGIEQPIKKNDIEGLRKIKDSTTIPIIVDESLVSLADAKKLVDKKACDIFNIRLSKCGDLPNPSR